MSNFSNFNNSFRNFNNTGNFGNYGQNGLQNKFQATLQFTKKYKVILTLLVLLIPLIVLTFMGFKSNNQPLSVSCISMIFTLMLFTYVISYRVGQPQHYVLLISLIVIEFACIIYFLTKLQRKVSDSMYVKFFTKGDTKVEGYLSLYDYKNKKYKLMDGLTLAIAPKEELPVNLGTEGTYSFWMKVCSDNFNKGNKQWKTVWYRGDGLENMYKNNTPGVYLAPNINNLIVTVACENGPDEGNAIILEDIPINEWFSVTIVLEGRSLDVYLNGLLEKSISLTGSPIMKNSDIIKGVNGFDGNLAFFRYDSGALVPSQIKKLYDRERTTLDTTKLNLEICSTS